MAHLLFETAPGKEMIVVFKSFTINIRWVLFSHIKWKLNINELHYFIIHRVSSGCNYWTSCLGFSVRGPMAWRSGLLKCLQLKWDTWWSAMIYSDCLITNCQACKCSKRVSSHWLNISMHPGFISQYHLITCSCITISFVVFKPALLLVHEPQSRRTLFVLMNRIIYVVIIHSCPYMWRLRDGGGDYVISGGSL